MAERDALSGQEVDPDGTGTPKTGPDAVLTAVLIAHLGVRPVFMAPAATAPEPVKVEEEPADLPGRVAYCARQHIAGQPPEHWFNVRLGDPVEHGPDEWTIPLSVKLPGVGTGPMAADHYTPKGTMHVQIVDGRPVVTSVINS